MLKFFGRRNLFLPQCFCGDRKTKQKTGRFSLIDNILAIYFNTEYMCVMWNSAVKDQILKKTKPWPRSATSNTIFIPGRHCFIIINQAVYYWALKSVVVLNKSVVETPYCYRLLLLKTNMKSNGHVWLHNVLLKVVVYIGFKIKIYEGHLSLQPN